MWQRAILNFKILLVTWCTNSLTFNNCTFCPHCIYVFGIYLRTNSDLCHLQHKLIGFYNRDVKCLLRGTNWGFKYSSLRFVFKRLKPGLAYRRYSDPTYNDRTLNGFPFRRFRKISKSDYLLRRVHPFVLNRQLSSHWTEFHEIFIFGYFSKTLSTKFKFH